MTKGQLFGLGVLSGVVVILGLLTALRSMEPPVYAQGADNTGMIGMVSVAMGSGVDGIAVLDKQNKRLALYLTNGGKELSLKAVRHVAWDLEGVDFKNEKNSGPSVADVKKEVEKSKKD